MAEPHGALGFKDGTRHHSQTSLTGTGKHAAMQHVTRGLRHLCQVMRTEISPDHFRHPNNEVPHFPGTIGSWDTFPIRVFSGRGRYQPKSGFCLMSVLPYPGGGVGGWVWQNFRVGGCPTPPPPKGRVGLCGGLGSIEPVPLLSFFCCRFRVTCLRCIYLSLHVTCACPTPIKGLGFFVLCVGCGGGNARTPQFLSLPHAHKDAWHVATAALQKRKRQKKRQGGRSGSTPMSFTSMFQTVTLQPRPPAVIWFHPLSRAVMMTIRLT